MIKTIRTNVPHRGVMFQDHALAHRYLDGLKGIEIGSAAHNPFHLEGSNNLAPLDDETFFRQSQIDMCGSYDEIDFCGEADCLPVKDHSQDYVISSHVIEHFPNPLAAFAEWTRAIREGGYVFMVVPLRNALPADQARNVSEVSDIQQAFVNQATVDTWDYQAHPIPGGRRGHYYVYTIDTMKKLIAESMPAWELVDEEAVDTKVGNGFTLVYRVHKELQPRDLEPGEMLQSVDIEMPLHVPEEAQAIIAEAVAEPEQIVQPKRKGGRPRKVRS